MDLRKYCVLTVVSIFMLLTFLCRPTNACSCMPSHPQTHFCNSDFVVIVRVLRKSQRLVAKKIAYKVEVKKSYKMNSESQKMLKHGRILTPDSDAACGVVNLERGKLYVIAGKTPQLTLCSYVKEYQKMSVIERRGFSGVYGKGCNCSIDTCFRNQCLVNRETKTGCIWSPFAKCETDYSACMMSTYYTPEGSISRCHWRKTPQYKACMSDP